MELYLFVWPSIHSQPCTGVYDLLFVDRFATDTMFQASNGDRANVPNYLVILTDGNSDNATVTWREAMRARANGINIITVSNSLHSSSHFHSPPHTMYFTLTCLTE